MTGGSGGIGRAICQQLARAGHYVYVHAFRQLDVANQLVEEIRDGGGRAQVIAFDILDADAVSCAIESVLGEGTIQILINNAGVHDDAVFPGMRPEQWHRVIDTSLDGFFHVTQPLMLPMIRERWGRIVNLTSVAALSGNRGQVNYAAAKGALNGATRALALEVATRGITVNSVAPGIISTPMSDALFDEETIARLVPMRRAGLPTEVASLVCYLVSEEAAFITGQVISINGGMI